jgi:hypothetical protein
MFFEGVDKLFGSFEVPDDLRAKLLLLYLSDEANSLFLRLEQAKREKHSEVKALLLKEFKLTPIQFKERFDRATRITKMKFALCFPHCFPSIQNA